MDKANVLLYASLTHCCNSRKNDIGAFYLEQRLEMSLTLVRCHWLRIKERTGKFNSIRWAKYPDHPTVTTISRFAYWKLCQVQCVKVHGSRSNRKSIFEKENCVRIDIRKCSTKSDNLPIDIDTVWLPRYVQYAIYAVSTQLLWTFAVAHKMMQCQHTFLLVHDLECYDGRRKLSFYIV